MKTENEAAPPAAVPDGEKKRIKKQITINIDQEALNYFKALSLQVDIPYQTLINCYLTECAAEKRELRLVWKKKTAAGKKTATA